MARSQSLGLAGQESLSAVYKQARLHVRKSNISGWKMVNNILNGNTRVKIWRNGLHLDLKSVWSGWTQSGQWPWNLESFEHHSPGCLHYYLLLLPSYLPLSLMNSFFSVFILFFAALGLHCCGFSCCRAHAPGVRASGVAARELSYCGSWAPKRGLSPCGSWG